MPGKLTRDPELKTTVLPDGHIVLHSKKTNRAFTLSPLAALVWEFCDGTNTATDIVDRLKQIDEVPSGAQLPDEVAALLKDFEESGMIWSEE